MGTAENTGLNSIDRPSNLPGHTSPTAHVSHKCMPFGLCNMPTTFQRLMQNCLGDLNLTYCLIYLDDVITFSNDEDNHLHHMRVILDSSGAPISDFSALAKLPRLRWIELGNDRAISKIPSLKGLKALRRLEVRGLQRLRSLPARGINGTGMAQPC